MQNTTVKSRMMMIFITINHVLQLFAQSLQASQRKHTDDNVDVMER